jgi:hypothetical protein
LLRFSVSYVSVFGTGGLSVPTVLRLSPGFYIPYGTGVPVLPQRDESCCLIVAAPKLGQGGKLSGSVNELELQNFLTMQVKEL